MTILHDALAVARTAHAGQVRKESGDAYIVHPHRVVAALQAAGVMDEEVLAAAALHDVVEDTNFTLQDVGARFGERVADFVAALTKNPGVTRQQYASSFQDADAWVVLVKLADRADNLMDQGQSWPWYRRDSWALLDAVDANEGVAAAVSLVSYRLAFDALRERVAVLAGAHP